MFKDITQVTQQQGPWKNTNVRKPFAFSLEKSHSPSIKSDFFFSNLSRQVSELTSCHIHNLELSVTGTWNLLVHILFTQNWQEMNCFIGTYFPSNHQSLLLGVVILIKILHFFFFFAFKQPVKYGLIIPSQLRALTEYQFFCYHIAVQFGPDLKWPLKNCADFHNFPGSLHYLFLLKEITLCFHFSPFQFLRVPHNQLFSECV